jgi:hypothetical protein
VAMKSALDGVVLLYKESDILFSASFVQKNLTEILKDSILDFSLTLVYFVGLETYAFFAYSLFHMKF